MHRQTRPAALAAVAVLTLASAACAASGSPPAPAGSAASVTPSVPLSGPTAPPDDTPTGCLGLGPQDCEQARSLAVTVLEADDPAAVYVQVGPFGCVAVERCPTTLTARPEGDVTIEWSGGTGINVHLRVAPDGTFEAERGEPMGIAVEAASPAGIPAGPFEFSLGHCGVFSGFDVDGSWWDPVGPVPMDSGEAVNATAGIITVSDPNHATFTTPTGFAVQLQRRAGAKLLPFCM